MLDIILGYLCALGFGALCLALSLVVYKLGMPQKYTRKLVHILVGVEWLILYVFFGASWHSFAVCAFFLALLITAYKIKAMPMIASDNNNAPGTVYYAASMSVISLVSVFVPSLMLPFGVAVLCTSLGDGFAGVIGQFVKKYNPKLVGSKTLFGTLSNLVISTLGTYIFSIAFVMNLRFLECLCIGLFSAVLEVVISYGLDNITVPLGVAALTYLIIYVPSVMGYVIPIILTPLIIALALYKKVLTPLGVIAAVVLDVVVSWAFGNAGFVVLFLFLALSIVADKLKARNIKKEEKNPRNELQVLANGTAALICSIAFIIFKKEIFAIAFVAAVAEALSDTVSSGIGSYASKTFDIFKWRKCEKGLSGGVSVIGTVGALISAFVLPLIAFAFGLISVYGMLIASLIAFLGCFIDTALGSLMQEKYKCKSCGKVTETDIHCNRKAEIFSGIAGIDNNAVNFISNSFTAFIIILVDFLVKM